MQPSNQGGPSSAPMGAPPMHHHMPGYDPTLRDAIPSNPINGPSFVIQYPSSKETVSMLPTSQLAQLRGFLDYQLEKEPNDPRQQHRRTTLGFIEQAFSQRSMPSWQDNIDIIGLALESGKLKPETVRRVEQYYGALGFNNPAFRESVYVSSVLSPQKLLEEILKQKSTTGPPHG